MQVSGASPSHKSWRSGGRLLWSAQLHLHAESPHGWDPQLEAHPKGDSDPGGPNDTRRIITNQKQQIKYPCYRIRDTQSLKDKQMHDNVQLPSSRGTMTRTLTLQVTRNRQHDSSRPSVQPNHQDYVSTIKGKIELRASAPMWESVRGRRSC